MAKLKFIQEHDGVTTIEIKPENVIEAAFLQHVKASYGQVRIMGSGDSLQFVVDAHDADKSADFVTLQKAAAERMEAGQQMRGLRAA